MVSAGRSKMSGGITILLVISSCCLSAEDKYGGGTGEPNDPYLIYDANQMNAIGADPSDWDKHFRLMADIDLQGFTGTQFNIIGNSGQPFTGVFDGNGKKILNFTYTAPGADYIGLFGKVSDPNALVSNLGLVNPNIQGHDIVGPLVGALYRGTVTGCQTERVTVSAHGLVGGLIGVNWEGGAITRCYSTGTVEGHSNFVGGLVGINYGVVSNCYSTCSVNAHAHHFYAGLIGANTGTGTIIACYATGKVTRSAVGHGGLVGTSPGWVVDSFWDIDTSGETQGVKGVGKTTVEMMQESTFVNWDFVEVWGIGENQTYPYLRTHSPGDINKDRITNFLDLCIIAEHWCDEE